MNPATDRTFETAMREAGWTFEAQLTIWGETSDLWIDPPGYALDDKDARQHWRDRGDTPPPW